MRKLLTFLIALAAVVAVTASSFAQGFNGGCFNCGCPACAGGAAWTPASLGANLIGWYKADTGITIFSTSSVLAWADQSGNGYNLVQAGGALPDFNATGLGGKPAVVWTRASSQQLATGALTSATVVWGTGSSYAIFGIASTTVNSVTGGYSDGWSAMSGDFNARTLSAGGSTPALVADYNAVSQSSKAMTINTSHRIGVNDDGTTATAYVDGSAGTGGTSLSGAFSTGYIVLGGANPTTGWDGPLSELIFVNRNLTPTELTQMDAYLASRQ